MKKKTWLSDNFAYAMHCINDEVAEKLTVYDYLREEDLEELSRIMERHLYNLELDIVDILMDDNREPY